MEKNKKSENVEMQKNLSKEKKKMIVYVVLLTLLLIGLIIWFVFAELKNNNIIGSAESNTIIKEFNKNYNSKDAQIIYYASSTCVYCELQKPILETIAEDYDLEYYSIDSNELSISQRNEVLKKLGIEHATPTIVIVKEGKVLDIQEGYTEGSTLVHFFKDNGILKEDAEYSAEKYITFIDYEEYEEIIEDDGKNIVVIGQTTCSHCIAFKPALNSVAEDYDVTINYLNITQLSSEEYNKFSDSLKKIKYNEPEFVESGKFGTPLTLIIKDGKVINYISGQRTYSQLVRELKKASIIK